MKQMKMTAWEILDQCIDDAESQANEWFRPDNTPEQIVQFSQTAVLARIASALDRIADALEPKIETQVVKEQIDTSCRHGSDTDCWNCT